MVAQGKCLTVITAAAPRCNNGDHDGGFLQGRDLSLPESRRIFLCMLYYHALHSSCCVEIDEKQRRVFSPR